MGDAPDAAQALLDQLRASLDGASYSTSAVYASLIIAFGGASFVAALVFILWHVCRDIYAARDMLALRLAAIRDKTTALVLPRLRTSIRDCWSTQEDELLQSSGLDAAVYMRSLRMMRNIFAVLTLVLFGTAAPINVVLNSRSAVGKNLTKQDALLLLTPSLLSKSQMIPHVVLGWVTNAVVLSFVWYNYRKILLMRQLVLADPARDCHVENRTVLILDLPKASRTVAAAARVTKAIDPQLSPVGITLGRSSKRLRELLAEYETTVKSYERALTDKASALSLTELQTLCGKLVRDIEAERASSASTSLPQGYAFVSFNSHAEAHAIAKRSRNAPDGVKVRLAPPPNQIIWSNVGLSPAERGAKQMWVNTIYGILLVLWIVPNAFIGCFLSNLSRLAAVWPAFGRSMASNRVGFAILQGFLAPTITTMVFMVLPYLFRKLSFLQGKVTRTDREHEVLRKLYAFFFLDNFFVFSMIGVVWDIVAQVLEVTNKARENGQHMTFRDVWRTLRIAQRIATAIVNISSFWVMYLLRGILGEFASSAQPISLLRRLAQLLNFVRKPTAREQAEATLPQPFQYAVGFLAILFHATIALGFTTIQPLVLPIAFVLYLLAVPIKKYELVHMQVTKYESNGLFWPLVSDITLYALAFGNLMLLCVVWVQAGWQIAIAAMPLAVTVLVFKGFMFFKYEKHFYYAESTESPLPLELSVQFSAEKLHSERVQECYTDPARTSKLSRPLLNFNAALCYLTGTELIANETPFEPDLKRLPSQDSSDDSFVESAVDYAQPYGRPISVGAQTSVPYTPVEPATAFAYDNESLYTYEPYPTEQPGYLYEYSNDSRAYDPYIASANQFGEQSSFQQTHHYHHQRQHQQQHQQQHYHNRHRDGSQQGVEDQVRLLDR